MNDVAVFVACGKHKRDSKQPIWSLYDSTLFQKSWTAAQMLGDPWVLSAKHGLVPPMHRHEPYDETLKDKTGAEKRTWAENIWKMVPETYDTVVVLGGRDYVEPLKETQSPLVAPEVELFDPYEETVGNGQQMSVAGELAWTAVEEDTVEGAIEAALEEAL